MTAKTKVFRIEKHLEMDNLPPKHLIEKWDAAMRAALFGKLLKGLVFTTGYGFGAISLARKPSRIGKYVTFIHLIPQDDIRRHVYNRVVRLIESYDKKLYQMCLNDSSTLKNFYYFDSDEAIGEAQKDHLPKNIDPTVYAVAKRVALEEYVDPQVFVDIHKAWTQQVHKVFTMDIRYRFYYYCVVIDSATIKTTPYLCLKEWRELTNESLHVGVARVIKENYLHLLYRWKDIKDKPDKTDEDLRVIEIISDYDLLIDELHNRCLRHKEEISKDAIRYLIMVMIRKMRNKPPFVLNLKKLPSVDRYHGQKKQNKNESSREDVSDDRSVRESDE